MDSEVERGGGGSIVAESTTKDRPSSRKRRTKSGSWKEEVAEMELLVGRLKSKE